MLSRRGFHALLVSGAMAAISSRPAPAAPARDGDAGLADLWLNRLTFGTTPASRAEFLTLGPDGWLRAQLARGSEDPDLAVRLGAARLRLTYEAGNDGNGHSWPALDELRPLSALAVPSAALLPLLNYDEPMDYALRARPADEVIAASLVRAVHAKAQLREVMTQFWHDHFNVTATKDETTAVFFPAYDRVMRANALGNFREMLGQVAKSPAMLNYLGNSESRASPANENFARELLELHTLGAENYLSNRYSHWSEVPRLPSGVAAGYIDEDVYEVARAFTGWSVGDGRWVADGLSTPRTGEFAYVETWHDPYQKRVLGREIDDHAAPLADGETVLDMLATHSGTARHVVTKIARRLLADDPPAHLIDSLVDTFLATTQAPDQIAQLIAALVNAPAFSTPSTKLRRPFEYVAALLRASGADVVSAEAAWRWELARAGWRQHAFGPPTGHPDRSEAWSNTNVIARMVDFALDLHEPWSAVTDMDLGAALPASAATYGGAVAHWSEAFGGDAAEAATAFLSAFGVAPDTPLPDDPDERRDHVTVAFAIVALGTRNLFR